MWVRGVPDKRLSITEIFKARFGSSVGSMFGGYCFKTEGGLNPKTGKGKAAAFWFFSACGVEVEVDTRNRQSACLAYCVSGGCGQSNSSQTVWVAERRLDVVRAWAQRFSKRWCMTTVSRLTVIS